MEGAVFCSCITNTGGNSQEIVVNARVVNGKETSMMIKCRKKATSLIEYC